MYVRLDKKNQRVIFLLKKKQIGEVKVKPYGDNLKEFFIYTKHTTSAQDVFLHTNQDNFDDETEKLFILLTRIYQNDDFDEEKSRDYGILKNDKKFKNLMFLVNRKYRNYYNELADELGLLAIARMIIIYLAFFSSWTSAVSFIIWSDKVTKASLFSCFSSTVSL